MYKKNDRVRVSLGKGIYYGVIDSKLGSLYRVYLDSLNFVYPVLDYQMVFDDRLLIELDG
jgi:hypothetical protein